MFFTEEQIHSIVKFRERGAHFSKDGWETLVAGSAKHRRTEVGGGDKQTILVAHSYNSSEHGDRLSRSDDPRLGNWYHEHVRNECSALAGKVTVRKAPNGLFAIVTTDPDARQKIAEMFGIRLIK
jgi:hypothetical protein